MKKTMAMAMHPATRRTLTMALLAALALGGLGPRAAMAQVPPDEAVKAQLAALGKRRIAELTTEMLVAIPWAGGVEPAAAASASAPGGEVKLPGKNGTPHEVYVGAIPALGALDSCARPTAQERAAVIKAVAAADPAMRAVEGSSVRFGCKEKGGILLDVAYEDQNTGTWKVVRASDTSAKARISVLASYRGLPSDAWMSRNNPVTLTTMALADLDGDGTRDALLAKHESVILTPIAWTTLSLWLSRKRKVVPLGTPDGQVAIAMQPWKPATSAAAAATPLVVRAAPYEAPGADQVQQLHYRCVQPDGRLDRCSAIEAARNTERALRVAQRFIAGELCELELDKWGQVKEPQEPCALDVEMMAEQLGVLGTAPAERAQLLARLPPPSAKVQVQRTVRAALDAVHPHQRIFGERVVPAAVDDPRRAVLMGMLGDAECTPVPPAQQKALISRLDAWIAGNAARTLALRGDCKPGEPCRWRKPERIKERQDWQTCFAGGRAQAAGRWTHLEDGGGAELAVDALFYVDRAGVKLVISKSGIGEPYCDGHCGGQPASPQFVTQLYRRGDALVALAQTTGDDKLPHVQAFTDGAATATPLRQPGGLTPYLLDERDGYNYEPLMPPVEIPSVRRALAPDSGQTAYWHWDGSWKQIAVFAEPGIWTAEPKLDAVGAWMWRQNQLSAARQQLSELDADEWATKPRYREEVSRALAVVNAPAELAARVQTLARRQ